MGEEEVVQLAYWDGLSQGKIADRTRQPLDTVKTRIRLGLSKLRDALGEGAASW